MRIPLGLMLLAFRASAAENPCSVASTTSDVRFSLALNNHEATFQAGEIVPLILLFTAETKNRYRAAHRNYDRSGRLGIEYYCVEPEAPDPLASFFIGGFAGGGLGGEQALDRSPMRADADLNEWRTLAPGHYRVYAISYRVWRPPDPHEQTPYGRVSEVVRSNTIEIDVNPPDPHWQREQLEGLARPLRFLNTKDSTKELAKQFWGLSQQQPSGWDLMLGLYGSPYRQLAIDSMHAELATPDHAITNDFLQTLVNLQVSADPSWDPPAQSENTREFWERRRAHTRELLKTEIQSVVGALPRKTGSARALTLHGLLTAGGEDQTIAQMVRPPLIAAWKDLPREIQRELIQHRWMLVASPEMLPILRRLVAEPPPAPNSDSALTRDAALKHIYELDPAAGMEAILHDLLDPTAQPGLDVIKLLSKEDVAIAVRPAAERIENQRARELDYGLLDRYGDSSVLGSVQAAFEERVGKWACGPQSAMLRYFLRVAPEYGAKELGTALSARNSTGCYRSLLQDLGAELPKVEQSALDALDDPDPDVKQNAVVALGRWGSSGAGPVLWEHLENLKHEESRAVALEQALMFAIAKGVNWFCPPDKLARLAGLVRIKSHQQQIESWIKEWKQGPALIHPSWPPEDNPAFSVLQYVDLREDQLRVKLAQFPRGTPLRWQFWPEGQIFPPVSIAKQEALYERIRVVAAQHGVILSKN